MSRWWHASQRSRGHLGQSPLGRLCLQRSGAGSSSCRCCVWALGCKHKHYLSHHGEGPGWWEGGKGWCRLYGHWGAVAQVYFHQDPRKKKHGNLRNPVKKEKKEILLRHTTLQGAPSQGVGPLWGFLAQKGKVCPAEMGIRL